MSNSFNGGLRGVVIGRGSLKGSVTISTVIGATEHPVYNGELCIIPSANEEQILSTANKLLIEDITIKKIPYAEVTNSANGTTITIA